MRGKPFAVLPQPDPDAGSAAFCGKDDLQFGALTWFSVYPAEMAGGWRRASGWFGFGGGPLPVARLFPLR